MGKTVVVFCVRFYKKKVTCQVEDFFFKLGPNPTLLLLFPQNRTANYFFL
jgi:hypothetical protein